MRVNNIGNKLVVTGGEREGGRGKIGAGRGEKRKGDCGII